MMLKKLAIPKRRGLSSIVGGMIFVVLMVAAFAAISLAINYQSDIVTTGNDVAADDLKKQQENFDIVVFTQPPDSGQAELRIQVKNKGSNTVEISNVVVAEITDFNNNYPTTVYDIPSNLSFITPGNQEDILPDSFILLDLANPPTTVDEEVYNIKVISSLGIIKTYSIICDNTQCGVAVTPAGEGSLSASLFLDGPTGVNTKVSTVVMFVTNTSDETITNVRPFAGFAGADDCDTGDFWELIFVPVTPNQFTEGITGCDVSPNAEVELGPHEMTIFKWDFTVNGDIGTEIRFCNYAQGIDPIPQNVNSQLVCDELTIIDPNDCDGCGEGGSQLILIDDLLVRPSLFMVIPSPFGLPTQPSGNTPLYKGLWGVNVVNPTEAPMDISKVTIAAYPPGSTPGDIIIDGDNDLCRVSDISPGDNFNKNKSPETTYRGSWSCPRINVLMWQNFTNPLTIDARSNRSFLAQVVPGSISSGDSLDAIIVQANVFTTAGSFGKAAYQTTMYQNNAVSDDGGLINVYLSTADNSRTILQSHRLGILHNNLETFKIVFADLDDDPDTYVNAGAKLIINVPREWTDVAVTSVSGFNAGTLPATLPTDSPSVTEFADSSTQIIGITDGPLGGNGGVNAKTITFQARAPDLTAKTPPELFKHLYVMYVLADGTQGAGVQLKSVGPLNEIVLQELPP